MDPNTPKINNLFSSMIPLKRRAEDSAKRKKGRSIFKLEILEGEPFLTFDDKSASDHQMTVSEKRVVDELKRVSTSNDVFGIFKETVGKFSVSIWQYPYLMNLLSAEKEIIGPDNSPIFFSDSLAKMFLILKSVPESKKVNITINLRSGDDEFTDPVILDDSHIFAGKNIYTVDSLGSNFSKIKDLVTEVETDYIETYLTLFLTYIDNVWPEYNGTPAIRSKHTEEAIPTIFLEKVASDKALYMRVGISIDSLGNYLPDGFEPTYTAMVGENDALTIRRVGEIDMSENVKYLEHFIYKSAPDRTSKKEIYQEENFFIIPESTAGPFLLNHLPTLLERFRLVGSEKLREYKVVAVSPRLNLKLSSGIDFLEGEGDVTIGEDKFTISDILNQFAKKRYIQLSDGNRGILDENYINRLQRLFKRRDKQGKIKVTVFNLPEVEELIQSKIKGTFASKTRKVFEGFNKLKKAKTPAYKVTATLRPYQNEGVKWLKYLYDNDLGGCLADDMGLGKTLQTISLLSMIYPGSELPSLVVMPRSLLFNWEKEIQKFAPQLTFTTYYGQNRNLDEAMQSNIILTTYALVRNDIEKLREKRFEVVILDESQNIKTVGSQITMSVQLLEANHKLALSGTPMENNLTELYSLFRFLNPPMFGTLEEFNSSYTYPIQKNGDKDASDSLRRKIFPFILRRLKKNVLDDLPPRIDQIIYVEMTEAQRKLYNERRISYKMEIDAAVAKNGAQKSQFLLFQALGELRRIASVPESASNGKIDSPKIEELTESLFNSVSNGHKSVVFFNFIAGLEIVAANLEKNGIEFETMTGSTSATARKRIVDRFQTDPECKVMLMTLKVGGVGLNLTAADTVYLFEPWWNKAAEEQAVNRLHRIGQKSTVNSFSLITVGTIEEKILQLQEQKSELFNELISEDGSSSKFLSQQDIDFILS